MKAVWLLIVLVILAGDCTTEHIGMTADERAKVSSAASTVAPRWVLTELRSSNPREEWRVYGSDHANMKYSPLEQITPQNVATLQIAWRWRSADSDVLQCHQDIRTNHYETTPFHGRGHIFLAAGGVQYARWPEAIDMGTWYITVDGYFCNTWHVWRGRWERCFAVYREGETFELQAKDRLEKGVFHRVPGNPEGY